MIMTKEEKEILIKDLSARLPYGVLIQEDYTIDDEMFLPIAETDRLVAIDVDAELLMTNGGSTYHIDEVKLYLFPLSSMTDEQKEEYVKLQQRVLYNGKGLVNLDVMKYVDWCYKHHIDIHGLIPMGLALDATNLNIY